MAERYDILTPEEAMRIRKETDILDREEIDLIAQCSDALAHPARVEIFRFIYRANMARETVCNKDVVEAFDYAQATVSQHLSRLVSSGLLDVQKQGSRTCYFVSLGVLAKYLNTVKKLNE